MSPVFCLMLIACVAQLIIKFRLYKNNENSLVQLQQPPITKESPGPSSQIEPREQIQNGSGPNPIIFVLPCSPLPEDSQTSSTIECLDRSTVNEANLEEAPAPIVNQNVIKFNTEARNKSLASTGLYMGISLMYMLGVFIQFSIPMEYVIENPWLTLLRHFALPFINGIITPGCFLVANKVGTKFFKQHFCNN